MEKKFYDTQISDGSIIANHQFPAKAGGGPATTTATMVDIKQGTGESERIGRKCTITNIYMRINFQFLTDLQSDLSAAQFAHETIHMMLVWDKQANGASPNTTEVLETDAYNSFRNLANNKRFVILYNKIIAWNAGAIGSGNGTANDSNRIVKDYQVNIAKKVFIPIEYSGTTGDIAEVKSNNIAFFVASKHGGRMEIDSSKVRLRFIDF